MMLIDMFGLVAHCYNLTTVPNYNTSNVEYMSSMFQYSNNITVKGKQKIYRLTGQTSN